MFNSNFTSYDFIGDIHGNADVLVKLLNKLGYLKSNNIYSHPEARKAIFMGDLIDRGPKILEVLQIVKNMVDEGNAFTIIGNHEYNFICYFTVVEGKYLRAHSQKNNSGIRATLLALNSDLELIHYYVKWFRTLPIYLDTENFRVVHAQWKQPFINTLKEFGINDFSNTEFLSKSTVQNSPEYKFINCLLKGEEIKVTGVLFHDKDGTKREYYRLKWWKKGNNFKVDEILFDFPSEKNERSISSLGYPENNVPLFFGHYCLIDQQIILQNKNCCCLDYCISKGGKLIAYRFNGEKELNSENFIYENTID